MRLVSFILKMLVVNCVLAQDTMFNRIDTIICSIGPEVHLYTPYDTTLYQSTWMQNDDQDLITTDSVAVVDNDSVIMITSFQDVTISDSIFIDTILIDLRIRPSVDISTPEPRCFDGSVIEVLDMSEYFETGVSQSYLDADGVELLVNDNMLSFLIGNGDSTTFRLVYDDALCPDHTIDSVFEVTTLLQPTAMFDFDKTCENDFLTIQNLSSNVETISMSIIIDPDNNTLVTTNAETFSLFDTLPHGVNQLTTVIDNQNGCVDTTSYDVQIDSVTYVSFDNLENEYCAEQDISTLVASITGGQFSGNGVTDLNDGTAVYVPIEPGSDVPISYTYVNDLECIHTDEQFVNNVYDPPNIILSNLMTEYCEKDPDVLLSINQLNNLSSLYEIFLDGQVFDASSGVEYNLSLSSPGSYLIENTYEDMNGCRDTLISTTIIHPLPTVDLDSVRIIVPGDVILVGNNGTFDPSVNYLWSNGSTDDEIEISQPGFYTISAVNVDTGCSISDTTRVEYNPAIEIQLLEISISPNPTSDFIDIQLSQSVSGIRLVDVVGNQVSVNGMNSFSTDVNGALNLNLQDKSDGYYYLLIPNIGNFLIVKI